MNRLKLQVKLITPCIIGSGTGYGFLIDTDIVFDDAGIPYIPAKRIKGCLRDSALEMVEASKQAGLSLFDESVIDLTFGITGNEEPSKVFFSNLTIDNYEKTKKTLLAFFESDEDNSIINREVVLSYFTELRQQTAIDKESGTAKEHSLRTIRALKRGLIFEGEIDIAYDDDKDIEDVKTVLYFASKNLRHIGTKRTRGFGFINCRLFDKDKELNYISKLEELCKR